MLREALITKNGIVGATLDLVVHPLEYAELMKFHATVESEKGPLKITHLLNAAESGNRDNLMTTISVIGGLLQREGIMLAIPSKTIEMYAVLNNVLDENTSYRSITLVLRPRVRYDAPVTFADDPLAG